jgi:serine/threonine protein kinase
VLDETVTIMVDAPAGQPASPLEIPRRVGNVRLGAVLGTGSGGTVLTGFDEALGRRVAVKVLHRHHGMLSEHALVELVEGVRSAAAVKHPNIVAVYSVERVAGLPMIVMELVDGLSLRELLKRCGALDVPLGVFVMRAVASGVEALHTASVVHRDLKPANVLIDRHGQTFVCDFGLAHALATPGATAAAPAVAGSPLYMAPEVFDGVVSPQGDVYALGAMLFEVLFGRPPFEASALDEIQQLHRTAPLALERLERRRVPAPLCEVVGRALHRQRILRYKTAAHLLRSLDDAAPPPPGDQLSRRLADMVAAGLAGGDASEARAEERTPAVTTFDLLARRAAEKRERRDEPG